ncbi:MAG: hypothetical protein AAGM36_13675 [Cyanobacteria bacterium J06597_1]
MQAYQGRVRPLNIRQWRFLPNTGLEEGLMSSDKGEIADTAPQSDRTRPTIQFARLGGLDRSAELVADWLPLVFLLLEVRV